MVKFGLTWLGGILALYGLADIIYETLGVLWYYGDLPIEARSEFFSILMSDEATAYRVDLLSDYERGIYNSAIGLIMLGIKRLLDAAEENNQSNVSKMTAKKDLGNWPPSV